MTAPAKAAPMRDDVTLADAPIGLFWCGETLALKTEYGNKEGRIDAYIVSSGEFFWGHAPQSIESQRATLVTPIPDDVANHRLTHTARPDAGEDKAEIERLRGLLIDPGTPPWEDARAVLVTELRKSGFDRHADYVEAVHGCMIPSDIVLNLIAQAARRPDAGDEDVERVAMAIPPLRVDWNKFDLAEAYDLVEGVRRDAAQDPESPIDTSLRAALEAIEAADCEWDGITMP